MQDTSHQMEDYLRKYCFGLLDLCQKRNLKNIALTWVTLGKNRKFDTLHSFQSRYSKIHIFLNVYILLCTYMLLYNVKLQSLQIVPQKKHHPIIVGYFFQQQRFRFSYQWAQDIDFPTLFCGIYFSFFSSAGKTFLRNKVTPFCLI